MMTRTVTGSLGTPALALLFGLSTWSACGAGSLLEPAPFSEGGQQNQGPTLDRISPNEGPTIGGIQIDLSGTQFADGARVTVGGVSASNVTVWSSTRITATLPKQPGFFGSTPIVVTNPDGLSAGRSDLFRYYLGAFPFRNPLLELGDSYTFRTDATAVATGDLNLDGVPDLAATGGLGVTLLLSNGRGGYTASNQIATGLAPTAVVIADLNADGRPDVVVANRDSGTVSVLLNDGQASFTRADFVVGQAPQELAVRDVDADALLDVATRNSTGEVRVLLGNGRGKLLPSFSDVGGVVPASAFTTVPLADFNGDGIADPVTLQTGAIEGRAVALLLSGASGSPGQDLWLELPSRAPVVGTGSLFCPPSVAVGDVDRDGVTDLVSLVGGSLPFSVAMGQKSGTPFSALRSIGQSGPAWPPAMGSSPISFVLGDANGDQALDILYLVSTSSEKFIAVALNAGNGTFRPPIISPHAGGYPELAAGDWNGDGKLDVAFPGDASAPVIAFLGDGTGRFTESFRATPVDKYEASWAIVTGDFNGDGKQDVVTGGLDNAKIILYLGNGSGGFAPAKVMSTRNETDGLHSFAVGDLNSDGRADLVAATWGYTWNVFLGSASEGLSAGVKYRASAFSVAGATIADFNRDQRQDLVVFGYGDPPRIYWGDGTGSFLGYTSFHRELGMFGFAADVNGDGMPDLLTRKDPYARNTRITFGSAL